MDFSLYKLLLWLKFSNITTWQSQISECYIDNTNLMSLATQLFRLLAFWAPSFLGYSRLLFFNHQTSLSMGLS
ncbi:hypothetical protein NP7_02535 [Moraxella osloensis]|uniref:Uncharacterized protein n=1 Tax=Faucicola osloensis TaxID=34062 RepID=A0A2D2LT90_FAUOS|nr:hypothetical protein NP7_02535 [Moraxella osloensis]